MVNRLSFRVVSSTLAQLTFVVIHLQNLSSFPLPFPGQIKPPGFLITDCLFYIIAHL